MGVCAGRYVPELGDDRVARAAAVGSCEEVGAVGSADLREPRGQQVARDLAPGLTFLHVSDQLEMHIWHRGRFVVVELPRSRLGSSLDTRCQPACHSRRLRRRLRPKCAESRRSRSTATYAAQVRKVVLPSTLPKLDGIAANRAHVGLFGPVEAWSVRVPTMNKRFRSWEHRNRPPRESCEQPGSPAARTRRRFGVRTRPSRSREVRHVLHHEPLGTQFTNEPCVLPVQKVARIVFARPSTSSALGREAWQLGPPIMTSTSPKELPSGDPLQTRRERRRQ